MQRLPAHMSMPPASLNPWNFHPQPKVDTTNHSPHTQCKTDRHHQAMSDSDHVRELCYINVIALILKATNLFSA